MPAGTQCVLKGGAVILGLCRVFSCCDFQSKRSAWSFREELLTSSRHSGPRSPNRTGAFGWLSMRALNFASILGSILDLILDQNSLIFQCLFALILKHRFLCDFEGIFVICL